MDGSEPQTDFDLDHFLPYLLNQASEATSRGFQTFYRDRYGMTRTQWRVMAHLGRSGAMTARDICAAAQVDKTKVSRAVAALEAAALLARVPNERDRRIEFLSLTSKGKAVFDELGQLAVGSDTRLRQSLGTTQAARLELLLRRLVSHGVRSGARG
jgi:DNA-binding MarR family transcriptional regulator